MMTLKDSPSRSRPLWASCVATGCFVAMMGMLAIAIGLFTGLFVMLTMGTVLVSVGVAIGLFGGYLYFMTQPKKPQKSR